MQQLAEQIAKRVHATTNWYKIAAKTSTIQFAILGALWGLIAGEWLYVAVLPLTTFVWGNALVQQQIRDALSWEQRLIIFVVAQLIVCYMAAGLTVAAVGWLRRIRRRRAR